MIIRPALNVFQRRTSMILLFGAFRPFEPESPISDAEVDLVQRIVGNARRYRQPLTFTRKVPAPGTPPQGVWLPGCQPRISDRVFDHTTDTAFGNPEFCEMYHRLRLFGFRAAGAYCDSSFQATLGDQMCDRDKVELISDSPPLQYCSTKANLAANTDSVLPHIDGTKIIDYFSWLNELRFVEYS